MLAVRVATGCREPLRLQPTLNVNLTQVHFWQNFLELKYTVSQHFLVFQLKELEEEWSKVEKGSPERYTRSQQAKMEEEGEEEEEEAETDGGE